MAKSKLIPKAKRLKIVKQAKDELEHARKYKEKRVASDWKKANMILDGKKKSLEGTRSNINIVKTKARGFVKTLLSRVDSAPNIKFTQGEEADLIKARRANALFEKDSAPTTGNWAFKDLMGKKGATKYGRTIFEYHASSLGGYKSHFELVNARYFFIDPKAGGVDIEKARYLGRTDLNRDKNSLLKGKDSKIYIRSVVDEIIKNEFRQSESQEEKEERNRFYTMRGETRGMQKADEWDFVAWNTTFEGERHYVIFHEELEDALRLEKFNDVFASGLWNYSTYATDPDEEEFWTPSPLDDVIEIFMGQHVLVNQQIDNNEQINQPMKGFDVGAIKNPAMLKWRRNGNIPFKKGTDMNRAIKIYRPDQLQNNVQTYNLLDNIAQTESGITADTKGLSEQDTLGIYEGNLQAAAERLSLLNKSYANCYNRLGLLYYHGLKEHLNEKVAIKMIGSKGVQYEEITKGMVVPSQREFDIGVVSADTGLNSETTESKNKLSFLERYRGDQTKNQEVIFEIEAELVGFETELIRRMQDVDNYGNAEILSQAAQDFQTFTQGDSLKEPNPGANTAYKQYFVDNLLRYGNNLKPEIAQAIIEYVDSIEDTVIRNTVRTAKKRIVEEQLAAPIEAPAPVQ